MAKQRDNSHKLPLQLTLAAVLMFGFGFALSPLYDVFCEITGLNGKITRTGEVKGVVTVDKSRLVRIQFIAINNEGMPWDFAPQSTVISVHPGEQRLTHFNARNTTLGEMVARAVPSVAPSEAAQYVHKVNCFCFEAQSLAGLTSQEMPLVLMIDPALPEHIRTVTLSYTLFDISAIHNADKPEPSAQSITFFNGLYPEQPNAYSTINDPRLTYYRAPAEPLSTLPGPETEATPSGRLAL
ncbi:MAG: cytochrome c oxidase assembly protein [Motiliproteus sp.]